MEKRVCSGYEIINVMQLKNSFGEEREIVLGYNEKAPSPYVTWKYYPDSNSYEHGCYCSTKEGALKSFFERGLDFMDLDLRDEYRKENAILDMEEALSWDFNEDAVVALMQDETFVSTALHKYFNLDHSEENEALRTILGDLYIFMVNEGRIFGFEMFRNIEESEMKNSLSVELKDGSTLTGTPLFNPKSSMTSFFLEREVEYVKTNLGMIPVIDYLDIKASELGFSSYEELRGEGIKIDIPKEYAVIEIDNVSRICLGDDEIFLAKETCPSLESKICSAKDGLSGKSKEKSFEEKHSTVDLTL